MANFDAIFDENLQEDEQVSQASDEHVQVTPEPVVIRGVGHMTVWVVFTLFESIHSKFIFVLCLFGSTYQLHYTLQWHKLIAFSIGCSSGL